MFSLILTLIAILGSLLWLSSPILSYLLAKNIPELDGCSVPGRTSWPKLSIVIAACNEEETISDALKTLCEQAYSNLEIVIVNDRSSDRTGEIIDQWANKDSRITVVHIDVLPEGWLGKVHALHRAVQVASGEWMLFTDADVHFHGDVLQRVIAMSERDSLDHLGLVPQITSQSIFAEFAIASSIRGISVSQKPWRIADPNSNEAMGAGAFNLVRAKHFHKTAGFAWLKMEVADDIGLAQMLKAAGGRTRMVRGVPFVSVEWYPSVPSLIRGLEKNAFAQIANFSMLRGVLVGLLFFCVPLSPFYLLLAGQSVVLSILALFAIGAAVACGVIIQPVTSMAWYRTALSFVFGDILLAWVVLRSTILGVVRGGVIWRGTVYPVPQLRAGRRVIF